MNREHPDLDQEPHPPQQLVRPDDAYNRELVAQVHPDSWINPKPSGRYNLVVVGGGTAGLVSAMGAAGLGAKVALVERNFMGGDCLNFGCVPSKALIRSARSAYAAGEAAGFGVRGALNPEIAHRVDFPAVMERTRKLRAGISHHDSVRRFAEAGIDVFLGQGTFTGPDTLRVRDATLSFSRAVVATGARAASLPIPGLQEAGYLTNETLFELTQLPQRLIVIGAGPIGCEMAQAFSRFGSEVSVVSLGDRVLEREDPAASAILQAQFQKENIQLKLGARIVGVEPRATGKVVIYDRGSGPQEVLADEILVAVGRAPNVEDLGLETAGVSFGRRGVDVDDRLRTSNKRIYAAGDICSRFKFTHAADAMARIVIQNALFGGRKSVERLVIPWATYTDPEVAHVGLTAVEAEEQGERVKVYTVQMAAVDRAILDGQTNGFARFYVDTGSGRLLGATVVAANAGDLISEASLAITNRLPAAAFSSTIHPYPTRSEVWKRLGDAVSRERLKPWVKRAFTRFLALRR
jgi:pyruvate/2-oxoglutarate dehydrogenase complex dihydrolipoamide dehydrogenase (E3) component